MILLILVAVFLLLATIVYTGVIIWEARQSVQNSPRAEMFVCPVHGPMPIGATFTVFDEIEVQDQDGKSKKSPLRMCAICFEDKIKKAQK